MPAITEASKNEKSLTNAGLGTDILVDEVLMTVDEADRPVDFLGKPIIKTSKNEKSLTNASENT